MVIVARIYLRFYIEVRVRVGTFLLTPTPPKFLPTPISQPCYHCAIAPFSNSALTTYDMQNDNDMMGVSYTGNYLLGFNNVLQCLTH
jgi:hypothetical protein